MDVLIDRFRMRWCKLKWIDRKEVEEDLLVDEKEVDQKLLASVDSWCEGVGGTRKR